MILIYTTNRCPYCTVAKEYFDKQGVVYSELNVEEDDEALADMIRKTGQMSVPVIEINGSMVVGFDRDHINDLLNTVVE